MMDATANRTPTTVVFDVGQVLIEWDPRHLYRRLFDDTTEMEHFLAEICTMEWNLQQDAGRSFADGVAQLVARHPQHADRIRAYDVHWSEMVPGTIDGSVDLLNDLAAVGVPLYAITNFSREKFADTRERFDFFEHFHGIVVSAHVGLIKPDPAIFEHFFARYALDPTTCVFIDDSLANITTAKRLGMHTVHFQSPEDTREQLRGWGLVAS